MKEIVPDMMISKDASACLTCAASAAPSACCWPVGENIEALVEGRIPFFER